MYNKVIEIMTERTSMNILFISDIYAFQGGNAVSVERVSTGLANKGHNVSIVTSDNKNIPAVLASPAQWVLEAQHNRLKNKKIYNIKRCFLTLDKKLNARLSIPTAAEVSNIFTESKPDIVVICTPTPMGYMFMKYAKKKNIPVSFWNHVIPEQAGIFFKTRLLKNRLIERCLYKILLWLHNQTDAVICPTNLSLKLLIVQGLKTDGYVISNGVDTNYFRTYGKKSKEFNIIYVGRLSPEKNIEILINTFDRFRFYHNKPHLYIIGTGCHIHNLISLSSSKQSSTQNIHFTGYVDDKKLLELYSNASVFVMPSPMELESIATLEAMSCNLPILVANEKLSAARFFVNGKNGFLFNTEDELIYRLSELYNNPELAAYMGRHSRKIAEEHDISRTIIQFEDILYNIIRKRTQ